MHQLIKSLIFLAACGLSLSATTEQLYKWVDQRGVTHYSKAAPTDPNVKVNKTIAIRRDNSAATRRQQSEPEQPSELAASSALESQQLLKQQQLEHQAQQQTLQEQKAQQQKVQQQNCLTARNKLSALENAGRVRQLDPANGQYRYLPDEEKLAQITRMRDYIRNRCSH